MLVDLQVLGQVRDARGQDRDLDLGGAGVALASGVLGDELGSSSSLVNVMVGRQATSGNAPLTAVSSGPSPARSIACAATSSAMAATSRSDRVVPDLVAQPLPRTRSRGARPRRSPPSKSSRNASTCSGSDAERGVGAHVDRGAVRAARASRRRPRRCPGRAAAAAARCAGSRSGSRAPGPGRGPRPPRRRARSAARAPPRASRGRRRRGRRGSTTTRPARPPSSSSGTPSAVRPSGAPIAGRVSIVPAALWPNVKFSPIAAWTACSPSTSTSSHERPRRARARKPR